MDTKSQKGTKWDITLNRNNQQNKETEDLNKEEKETSE